MQVNDLRTGSTFLYGDNIYVVIDQAFSKTGRQQGKVTVKVKNLRTGARTELTFTTGDRVEKAIIDHKDMQYLYSDEDNAYFMNVESYEQVGIPLAKLEWEKNFLNENVIVKTTEYEGEILQITLPDKVKLKVFETEAAVKGDTTSGAKKRAILETGWELQVQLFVSKDAFIWVKTSDGKYDGVA